MLHRGARWNVQSDEIASKKIINSHLEFAETIQEAPKMLWDLTEEHFMHFHKKALTQTPMVDATTGLPQR